MVADTFTHETLDRDGQILDYAHAEGAGSGLELQIQLKRLGPAGDAYSGKQNGKPISGKFKTKGKMGIATGKTIAKAIREQLLSGKSTSFKTEEYAPSLDPTVPIETLYEIESKEERRIRSSFGPVRIVGKVDERGDLERTEAHVGSAVITEERILA